jgi:hypothetical protein
MKIIGLMAFACPAIGGVPDAAGFMPTFRARKADSGELTWVYHSM